MQITTLIIGMGPAVDISPIDTGDIHIITGPLTFVVERPYILHSRHLRPSWVLHQVPGPPVFRPPT